jgi:hypothetical protein
MNAKKTLIFLALCVGLAVAAFFLARKDVGRQADDAFRQTPLLTPEERSRAESVRAVELRAKDKSLTLELGESGVWRIKEKQSYPADTAQVRGLLLKLLSSILMEAKTADESRYPRLGLDEASAVRIGMRDAGGRELFALYVGKTSQEREATYVRKEGQTQAYLASSLLDASTDAMSWADSKPFALPEGTVARVGIALPGKEPYEIERAEGADAWTLKDVPEGYEAKEESELRAVVSSLGAFYIEDVKRADAVPSLASDKAARVTFSLTDGGRLDGDFVREEGSGAWARFKLTPPSAKESEKDKAAPPPAINYASASPLLEGWAFRVPDFLYEDVTKEKQTLLRPKAEDKKP